MNKEIIGLIIRNKWVGILFLICKLVKIGTLEKLFKAIIKFLSYMFPYFTLDKVVVEMALETIRKMNISPEEQIVLSMHIKEIVKKKKKEIKANAKNNKNKVETNRYYLIEKFIYIVALLVAVGIGFILNDLIENVYHEYIVKWIVVGCIGVSSIFLLVIKYRTVEG